MAWLRVQPLAELTTTAVTLAEIHYGLSRLPHGRRRDDLTGRVRRFLAQAFGERVLAFDARAAELYGEIVALRQAAGRPVDALDAMIAATVRAHGASLATRNLADFDDCGIPLIDPWGS
jgi:predicted nucleic acid-binding protein